MFNRGIVNHENTGTLMIESLKIECRERDEKDGYFI